MIIQETVEVWVQSNQTFDAVEYWQSKGYDIPDDENHKWTKGEGWTKRFPNQKARGTRKRHRITVKVSDLPKFSSAKVMFRCDGCGHEWKRRYSKIARRGVLYTEDLCHKCSRKVTGERQDRTKTIEQLKARTGDNHPRWNPDSDLFTKYRNQVTYLTGKVYEANKQSLNPDNLLIGRNGTQGAYQIDHKISVKWGYDNGWTPEQLSAIDNLQLLPWEENRDKW